jgi:hypothetical protein
MESLSHRPLLEIRKKLLKIAFHDFSPGYDDTEFRANQKETVRVSLLRRRASIKWHF